MAFYCVLYIFSFCNAMIPRSYIDAPKKLDKKFDIILDDGRARWLSHLYVLANFVQSHFGFFSRYITWLTLFCSRVGVAKAALQLLEQGGRFLLFSNLIIFWTVHLVKSSSHLNWYFQGGNTWLGTSLLQRGSQVTWLCFGNRGEHLCLWRKNKKQTHLLC